MKGTASEGGGEGGEREEEPNENLTGTQQKPRGDSPVLLLRLLHKLHHASALRGGLSPSVGLVGQLHLTERFQVKTEHRGDGSAPVPSGNPTFFRRSSSSEELEDSSPLEGMVSKSSLSTEGRRFWVQPECETTGVMLKHPPNSPVRTHWTAWLRMDGSHLHTDVQERK